MSRLVNHIIINYIDKLGAIDALEFDTQIVEVKIQ